MGSDPTSLAVQILGTLLFSCFFFFLWRRSGIVYFGLWAAAWAVAIPSLVWDVLYTRSGASGWLALYALSEFTYLVLLLAAGRAGLSGSRGNWRLALRVLLGFPLVVALVYLLRPHGRPEAYYALHAGLLCAAYLYNFAAVRVKGGTGAKLFRLSLLWLSAAFVVHTVLFLYSWVAGRSVSPAYVLHSRLWDLPLDLLLAFSAMALWIESQDKRLHELDAELDRVRRETQLDLDHLTGLLNQSALARRMEDTAGFSGVVAVCDMDNFKEVNDHYGHLVGDEILSNIGHLLRSSIRQEDEAFRWGGDEFVILFYNQQRGVAESRMRAVEARLRDFRVRGHGTLAISFSWGTAESAGHALRESLDEADHAMYAFKRNRKNAEGG